jgi:hypothetical protein
VTQLPRREEAVLVRAKRPSYGLILTPFCCEITLPIVCYKTRTNSQPSGTKPRKTGANFAHTNTASRSSSRRFFGKGRVSGLFFQAKAKAPTQKGKAGALDPERERKCLQNARSPVKTHYSELLVCGLRAALRTAAPRFASFVPVSSARRLRTAAPQPAIPGALRKLFGQTVQAARP